MIDFHTSFQIRARSEEEARTILDTLEEYGCRWNSGDELNPNKANWGIYREHTIYDVWCRGREYGHVLYGSIKDQSCETYELCEFLQELHGEEDQELNIESLL